MARSFDWIPGSAWQRLVSLVGLISLVGGAIGFVASHSSDWVLFVIAGLAVVVVALAWTLHDEQAARRTDATSHAAEVARLQADLTLARQPRGGMVEVMRQRSLIQAQLAAESDHKAQERRKAVRGLIEAVILNGSHFTSRKEIPGYFFDWKKQWVDWCLETRQLVEETVGPYEADAFVAAIRLPNNLGVEEVLELEFVQQKVTDGVKFLQALLNRLDKFSVRIMATWNPKN